MARARKHSPSPDPTKPDPELEDEADDTAEDAIKREADTDSEASASPKSKKRKRKPAATPNTTTKKPKAKTGRKPGVAYASKRWTGAEFEQLFILGLGAGQNCTVPAERFEDMPMRSTKQCTNAWRQRVIPIIRAALRDAGEPDDEK